MIRAIVFDAGGVLIDDGVNRRTIAQAAARYGLPAAQLSTRWSEVWHPYECNAVSIGAFWSHVLIGTSVVPDTHELLAMYAQHVTPVPGMREMVERLSESGAYTLVLANNEGKEFDTVRDHVVGHIGLFDAHCASWMLGYRKPMPEFFNATLDRIGIPAQECLFIDDKIANVEAARACGMEGIVFTDARQLARDLTKYGITVPEHRP